MMEPNERLMAYVDGELDPAARAAFEQELAARPELEREVARQQALRRRLSAAFDPVLDEPTPLQLTLAAQAANTRQRGWRAPHWAAMAACLALGVLVGRGVLVERGAFVESGGALLVRGDLARALDSRLAADAGPIRVGLTFRTAEGRYCRTFQSAPDRLAGLACRQPQGWRAETLAAWSPAPEGGYRQAGSDTPAPVLAAVDAMISGSPLDAAAERAARGRGWKP